MIVERRYCKRISMDGDVYIRYRRERLCHAQAVNISNYGIYLKSKSLTLLTGTMIELELFRGGHKWLVVGLVAHCQADGVGIMFRDPQIELYGAVEAGVRQLRSVRRQQAGGFEQKMT